MLKDRFRGEKILKQLGELRKRTQTNTQTQTAPQKCN